MPDISLRLTVSGQVQGVGYRYHCAQAARELGLRGYVRNLSDGDVETVVSGDKADIDSYIKEITRTDMAFEVNGIKTETVNASENFTGFMIRY